MQGCRRTARLGLRRFGLHLKNQGMAWAVVGRFLLAISAVVKCHIGRTATNYDLPNFMPIHSASSGMRPTLIASSAMADASDNQMGRSQSMNRLQSDTHGFAKSYSHRVVRRELSDTCAFSTKSSPRSVDRAATSPRCAARAQALGTDGTRHRSSFSQVEGALS